FDPDVDDRHPLTQHPRQRSEGDGGGGRHGGAEHAEEAEGRAIGGPRQEGEGEQPQGQRQHQVGALTEAAGEVDPGQEGEDRRGDPGHTRGRESEVDLLARFSQPEGGVAFRPQGEEPGDDEGEQQVDDAEDALAAHLGREPDLFSHGGDLDGRHADHPRVSWPVPSPVRTRNIARTTSGAAMKTMISAWITVMRSMPTPLRTCITWPPARSAPNSRPARTTPPGWERPRRARAMA